MQRIELVQCLTRPALPLVWLFRAVVFRLLARSRAHMRAAHAQQRPTVVTGLQLLLGLLKGQLCKAILRVVLLLVPRMMVLMCV